MRHGWRRRLGCLAVLVLAQMSATPGTCAEPPPILHRPTLDRPTLHRIVAIGDLHGDFDAWRAIARAAGLVDKQGRWVGGETVLVQTGDVVDRGPDSRKLIQDLMRLQHEAARRHGRIIALVGNHEAMNITGDLRYVSAADYAAYADGQSRVRREQAYARNITAIEAQYRQGDPALGSATIRQAWLTATPLGYLEHLAAWRPDGAIGRWVIGNPAVIVLDGVLFVHGGISPAYARVLPADINALVATALAARTTAPDAIINDEQGPLWYRGLALPADGEASGAGPDPTVTAQLDALLPAAGAGRIVIAHTPRLAGIAVLQGGRLIRIDTGISAVYGGKLSYLEILDGALTTHEVERPSSADRGKR